MTPKITPQPTPTLDMTPIITQTPTPTACKVHENCDSGALKIKFLYAFTEMAFLE